MTSKTSTFKESEIDLDVILQELGDFGKFQKLNFILLLLPIVLSSVYTLSYIFTASQLEYRYVH